MWGGLTNRSAAAIMTGTKRRGISTMAVIREPFGRTKDGREVEKLTLRRGTLEAEVLTYGGVVAALRTADRTGTMVDVVLGYRTLAGYEENGGYLGALVGRYANRIGGARITIDGQTYPLTANEGTKQLHGGPEGFSFQVFDVAEASEDRVVLTYTEPDGKNGFPGTLALTATYALTENGLSLRYEAVCDKPTVCNITNHSYFNLNGGGSAMDHRLWVDADAFTPIDADSLPVAASADVAGTPFDFRTEKAVGRDIGQDHEQLRLAGGYDHNFVLTPKPGLRLAAHLTGERSGITMECWTEQPGVQVYTANFLETDASTKSGVPYGPRQAVCLETQVPADSPNHPEWRDVVLRPGQVYDYTTEYRFL